MTHEGSTRHIGVALSGGGHRATVFGLGALLALVDQGLNREVVSVASVSGGSIANGIAMVGPDYGTVDTAGCENHLKPALKSIADRGVLQKGAPRTKGYMAALISSAVLLGLSFVTLVVGVLVGVRRFAVVAIVALALGLLIAWTLRNKKLVALLTGLGAAAAALLAHWWIARIVALPVAVVSLVVAAVLFSQRGRRTRDAIDFEELGAKHTTLASLASTTGPTGVHHVICTTELQSGEEYFFSPRATYGYRFGGHAPGSIPLATAVQASACVPGAFNPVVLDHGGKHLVLDDGGVYDNMADEWEYGYTGRMASWPGLKDVQANPATHLIVINASKGWEALKPIKGKGLGLELAGVLRAKDVQYDVSTSHRRRALFSTFTNAEANGHGQTGTFAQISRSPHAVIDSFITWTGSGEPDATLVGRQERAKLARDFLNSSSGRDKKSWQDVTDTNSGIKTTLAKLGKTATADLLEHGYVLTMVNLYVLHEMAELKPVSRARFEALCN
jgi:hypothetical protein